VFSLLSEVFMTIGNDRKIPFDGERCLSPEEVAFTLKTTQRTLARWRSDRTGPPFFKLRDGKSGSVRYPYEPLRRWLDERVRKSKDGPAK
jgi:hypothetical protein